MDKILGCWSGLLISFVRGMICSSIIFLISDFEPIKEYLKKSDCNFNYTSYIIRLKLYGNIVGTFFVFVIV